MNSFVAHPLASPEVILRVGKFIPLWILSKTNQEEFDFKPKDLLAAISVNRLFHITLTPLLWTLFSESAFCPSAPSNDNNDKSANPTATTTVAKSPRAISIDVLNRNSHHFQPILSRFVDPTVASQLIRSNPNLSVPHWSYPDLAATSTLWKQVSSDAPARILIDLKSLFGLHQLRSLTLEGWVIHPLQLRFILENNANHLEDLVLTERCYLDSTAGMDPSWLGLRASMFARMTDLQAFENTALVLGRPLCLPKVKLLCLDLAWEQTCKSVYILIRAFPGLETLMIQPDARLHARTLSWNLREFCPLLGSIQCIDERWVLRMDLRELDDLTTAALLEHKGALEILELVISGDEELENCVLNEFASNIFEEDSYDEASDDSEDYSDMYYESNNELTVDEYEDEEEEEEEEEEEVQDGGDDARDPDIREMSEKEREALRLKLRVEAGKRDEISFLKSKAEKQQELARLIVKKKNGTLHIRSEGDSSDDDVDGDDGYLTPTIRCRHPVIPPLKGRNYFDSRDKKLMEERVEPDKEKEKKGKVGEKEVVPANVPIVPTRRLTTAMVVTVPPKQEEVAAVAAVPLQPVPVQAEVRVVEEKEKVVETNEDKTPRVSMATIMMHMEQKDEKEGPLQDIPKRGALSSVEIEQQVPTNNTRSYHPLTLNCSNQKLSNSHNNTISGKKNRNNVGRLLSIQHSPSTPPLPPLNWKQHINDLDFILEDWDVAPGGGHHEYDLASTQGCAFRAKLLSVVSAMPHMTSATLNRRVYRRRHIRCVDNSFCK
ncbi:hypothetical protein BGX33_009541 [Mortierella sp. NVP41]|nr:hypothetical protein BGX33_009541 [Mortierella sp. NVP41]